MQTQKKQVERAPKPDPQQAEAWARIVETTRESAQRAPEAYLKDTEVPAGGE